jgi:hypothetical protein
MNRSIQAWLCLAALLLVACAVFLSGITWGLPSRAVDPYLFGDREPWSGSRILELGGGWDDDPARGADVDVDPLEDRSRAILLNGTDAQRAAIIRRYRLFTYQPDEMITLRALAGMRPAEGRLDPRLYQYGGLWIYPVGALLKAASMTGAITLTPDLAWYLDHPEAFGRLYLVSRVYTVLWGLVGVALVFWLARRLAGGRLVPAVIAAACFICMPVVVNMVHEAKPHLPGAVLQFMAVAGAVRYAETGRRRWWAATAAACGAAFGMVLSAWPIFIVLPLMTLLRPHTWIERLVLTAGGIALGVVCYLFTNPYILINLFINQAVLRSNFGNSLAMYEIGRWGEGFVNAALLMAEGTSPFVAVVGVAALAALLVRRRRRAARWGGETRRDEPAVLSSPSAAAWLLAAPAILIFVQFTALAAGKPGEYGRFAVYPDIALAIAAVTAVHALLSARSRGVIFSLLVISSAVFGWSYLARFRSDASDHSSRLAYAQVLDHLAAQGADTLGLGAEPAPYNLPPVDLFRWRLLLVPEVPSGNEFPDFLIRPLGVRRFSAAWTSIYRGVGPESLRDSDPAAISWAGKYFEILARETRNQEKR